MGSVVSKRSHRFRMPLLTHCCGLSNRRLSDQPNNLLSSEPTQPVASSEAPPIMTERRFSVDDSADPNSLKFGPMQLKHTPLKVMFVFAQEDAQCQALCDAAAKNLTNYFVRSDVESAISCFSQHHPQAVFVDARRSNTSFKFEHVCRTMRQSDHGSDVVLVAVTDSGSQAGCVLPLLEMGFNRHFAECVDALTCYNELLCLEYTDIRQQSKLRSALPLFTALELCSDAIEVTDSKWNIQYVNSAHERIFGYSAEELQGRPIKEFVFSNTKNPVDLQDTIETVITKGRLWEGVQYVRNREHRVERFRCHCMAITGVSQAVDYIVSVRVRDDQLRKPSLTNSNASDKSTLIPTRANNIPQKAPSSSSRKVQNMAPIQELIETLSQARDEMSVERVQFYRRRANTLGTQSREMLLDRALTLIQTTDLFSLPTGKHLADDQMTRDYTEVDDEDTFSRNSDTRRSRRSYVKGLMARHVSFTPDEAPRSRKTVIQKTVIFASPKLPLDADTMLVLDRASPVVNELLSEVLTWDFKVIKLEMETARPLVYTGMAIMRAFDIFNFLDVSAQVVQNWLVTMEAHYVPSNTYHNSTHAADVLQAASYLINKEKVRQELSDLEVASAVIASIAHDVNHPGRTNPFLINSKHELAILYNDQAVLENHHAALTFKLTLNNASVNIFATVSEQAYKQMRGIIIDMILATEMSKHFEHLNRFTTAICQPLRNEPDVTRVGVSDSTSLYPSLTPLSHENKGILLRLIVKCADINNPARPKDMCIKWAGRIAEEYFRQTDEEERRGLPVVMPVFNRKTCRLPNSQTTFVDLFLIDMYQAFNEFCEIPEVLDNLEENYAYWRGLDLQQQAEQAESAPAES